MSQKLNNLKSRLSHVEWRLRGLDRMIRDSHLWGMRIAEAHEQRAPLILERDQLADQIAAIETFEATACDRLHS
jgi:hypothetical protein